MIDVNRDRLLTLKEMANKVPGRDGRPVSYGTVCRWAAEGVRGIRLETVLVGGSRKTSEGALAAFVANLNGRKTKKSRPENAKQILREEFGLKV